MRCWIACQTRRGGAIGAAASSSGARRACQSATRRRSCGSSLSERSKRRRAAPLQGAQGVLRRQRFADLFVAILHLLDAIARACASMQRLEPVQPAPDPGLDRPQRLAHVLRQLGVRQPVQVGEHDALALAGAELLEAVGQRARVLAQGEQGFRPPRLVGHGLHQQIVVLAAVLEVRAPQPVERAVANDRGHPGHRRTLACRVLLHVVPDVDEALLQHVLGPVLPAQYTQGDAVQFRGGVAVQLAEGALVAQHAARHQLGYVVGINHGSRQRSTARRLSAGSPTRAAISPGRGARGHRPGRRAG